MATIVIQPDPTAGKDSLISIADPNTNYGTNENLQINKYVVQNTRSLIQFDLSVIPAGSVINSATFAWYLWNLYLVSPDITIYRINQDWGELTVTWNNQPTYADNIGSYLGKPVGWVTTSITSAVQNWVNGVWANWGFIFLSENPATQGGVLHYSSDYLADTSKRPKLTVDYTPPPPKKLLMGVGV